MNSNSKNDGFSTKVGFMFAAAGSAIGLGNLWKFPYILGANGGGAFLIVYVVIILIVAIPCCVLEGAIGRYTGIASGTGAYAKIAQEKGHSKAFGFIGFMGVLACLAMLFYYSVVGGWVLKYFVDILFTGLPSAQSAGDKFTAIIRGVRTPILYNLIFLALTVLIVLGGIKNGIEKYGNIMMPALFVILIVLVVRSLTMPRAFAGVKWMLMPDFGALNGKTFMAALSQVFFSCSLGNGVLITYAAYSGKETNILKSATCVPILDTAIALLAGFAIIPAVFSAGIDPLQGPGLLFITIPTVLNSFGPIFGRIFGVIFFLLALFAALTTSIAMVELPVAYLMNRFGMSRTKSVLADAAVTVIFSCCCSMAMGAWSDVHIFGRNFFDFFDFVSATLLMPLGGMFEAIFVGYIWKAERVIDAVTSHGKYKFTWFPWFKICVKYVVPIMIFLIFLSGFGLF